jgi:hypothetical protein
MATATLTLRVRWAWWWRCLYWPLTRFGVWLGLPLNPHCIAADAVKATKLEVV